MFKSGDYITPKKQLTRKNSPQVGYIYQVKEFYSNSNRLVLENCFNNDWVNTWQEADLFIVIELNKLEKIIYGVA